MTGSLVFSLATTGLSCYVLPLAKVVRSMFSQELNILLRSIV